MAGLLDCKRWDVLPSSEDSERMLCRSLGVSPIVARVMCARGVSNPDAAREFLAPSLERDWVDPFAIPGMGDAADRLESALVNGERIAVFGDFDVDGMTSTCLLTLGLRAMGGDVWPYIPHRFGEGYGLSHEALNRVLNDSQPQLIVTVDNGIASGREVAWLLEQGVDVVITDHHEPGDAVPQGVPVTDPKLSATCPSRELAGVGVALKLVNVLGERFGMPELWKSYKDLAAMGTISDMMLLQGENRALVAEGIAQMRHSTRPGIVALAASAGCDLATITSDNLPFSLIPRLNAAGRMGTTEVAFDLLICEDPAEAAILAAKLERVNNERREVEGLLSEQALQLLESSYKGERVVVLAGEGWHEGVKGIVASRVVGMYHVPALIFTIEDGVARGSGRSVGSVDLFHAVEQCSDVLIRFGGHSGAVGVTCKQENLEVFRQRLQQALAQLPEEDFEDKGEVTALATLDELDLKSIQELEALQPFGQGNKRPLFGIRGVFMRNRARVGYDGSHLRFLATDGVRTIPAIMFRTPNMGRAYACDGLVDLVVDAVSETWQGRTQGKLMVRDIVYRSSEECPASTIDPLLGASGKPVSTNGFRAEGPASDFSGMSEQELTNELGRRLIGDAKLLPAQKVALGRLSRGCSSLCIMATGRGKSLIFQIHAARLAITSNKASIFVYPLRALVSDQAFHLESAFSQLGLSVRVLTGESGQEERRDVFDGLDSAAVDIVLTTPEFLAIHTKRFGACGRIGFVVVDEAHHAGVARSGVREAYTEFDRVLRDLNDPTVLAVTATASAPVAREICKLLSIRENNVIVDRTVRGNLVLDDYRDLRDRDLYLASLVSVGNKTVVYVNSRDRAISLARHLRNSVPELGERIAFYHAGLSREVRAHIEREFRDGRLCCIVSTSAFGEGVNLPSIRNVVLYHMPFGFTEFNQMSGRAGRDGSSAHIHLLFGSRDARINESILASAVPKRSELVVLYKALRYEERRCGMNSLTISNEDLLVLARQHKGDTRLDEQAVASGIAVFDELGFLRIEGYEKQRRIVMATSPNHVDLDESIRYSEGMRTVREFMSFRDWVLSSRPQEILSRINRPIVPGFGITVDK